jgi:hypothetical protein
MTSTPRLARGSAATCYYWVAQTRELGRNLKTKPLLATAAANSCRRGAFIAGQGAVRVRFGCYLPIASLCLLL